MVGVAVKIPNDGISIAQTRLKRSARVDQRYQRMRDLALRLHNGSNSAEERKALNQSLPPSRASLLDAETTTFPA